jgi:hypothetical protein
MFLPIWHCRDTPFPRPARIHTGVKLKHFPDSPLCTIPDSHSRKMSPNCSVSPRIRFLHDYKKGTSIHSQPSACCNQQSAFRNPQSAFIIPHSSFNLFAPYSFRGKCEKSDFYSLAAIPNPQSAIANQQSKIRNQKFILPLLSFFHPTIRFFFDTRIEYPHCD